MSYPGYPPDHQGFGPPNPAPYPSQGPPPYPQRPPSYLPNSNPSFGFNVPMGIPEPSYPRQPQPGCFPSAPTPSHTYPLPSQQVHFPNVPQMPFEYQRPVSQPHYPGNHIYSNIATPNIATPYNATPHITTSHFATPIAGSHHGSPHINKHNKTPTVYPAPNFNASADAEALKKAMKGFGTDEKAIISILTKRSNVQRLDIAAYFKNKYGKELLKELKSELSGKFEDVILALMTPVPEYYAKELKKAVSGVGTNESVLIEVFCTLTNAEIRNIRTAYHNMYNSNLEKDISGDTSGDFRHLLISLCNAQRDESGIVNYSQATTDAEKLLRAGVKQVGTNESVFNDILCNRNYAQLIHTFDEYKRIAHHDIEDAIKKEFSGDIKDGFLALISAIRDLPAYFAKRLHDSMSGMGTNDEQLIRIIVLRSEIDMGEIKTAYAAKYKTSLESAISGDSSGDYKKCLLGLIGASSK